jgi:hypothetical protein
VAAPDTEAVGAVPPAACAAIDCICCSADKSGLTGNVMFSPEEGKPACQGVPIWNEA